MMPKIKNRLLAGNEVVMELEAASDSTKAWLAIYPLKVDSIRNIPSLATEYEARQLATSEIWAYRLLEFEVGIEYIENDWDVSEDEMLNQHGKVVFGFEALEHEFSTRGLDSNLLLEPWKTNYPL